MIGREGRLRSGWWSAAPVRHVAAFGIAALFFLTAVSFARVALAEYQLNQQKLELRRQVAALQAENQQLQEQYAQLQTDAAIEKLAREQLGWTGPNDTAVIVEWTRPAAPAVQSALPLIPESRPVWRQWWDLFLGT